jgi:putative aldouronate transport system substrate-binding protein
MKKRWLIAGTSLLMTAAVTVTGCSPSSTGTEKPKQPASAKSVQFPLEQPLELKIFANTAPQVKKDYNDMQMFKELQKQTSVKVQWTLVSNEQLMEKKNILVASGDLPDAFYGLGILNDQEIIKLGSEGGIIPLEGLIETHAPNLKKVFEKRPELKKRLTAPDGHIYSLPNVQERIPGTIPQVLFINKKWLDQLGLPLPTTVSEFHSTLKAFREKDPNGNGMKDEIPFSFLFNNSSYGSNSLAGSFGVKMDDPVDHLYLEAGKVKYAPAQPEYEAYLQFLSKLYKEKLLDQEVFTHNQNAYLSKIRSKEQQVGAFVGFALQSIFGDLSKDYVPLLPLKGENGQQGGWLRKTPGYSAGSFAITSANKHPEITMKWMDTMYDEKLSFQFNGGPFGLNMKENADGTMEKLPTPAGLSGDIFKHSEAPGNNATVIILKETLDRFIDPTSDEKKGYYQMYDKYAPRELIVSTLWDSKDVERITPIETDLHGKNGYYDSTFARFVMDGFTSADWDNHLAQLKKMRLEEYVAINQKYYDMYRNRK